MDVTSGGAMVDISMFPKYGSYICYIENRFFICSFARYMIFHGSQIFKIFGYY